MSANEPLNPDAANAVLSPEARALLAEIEGKRAVVKTPQNQALAEAFFDTDSTQADEMAGPPVVLAPPHDDAKANAFADLLDHLDDKVSASADAAAVAERYRAERMRPTPATPSADALSANTAHEDSPGSPAVMADEEATVLFEEELGDSDALDDDADFDFEIDERPGGVRGFFSRLGGTGGRAVKRLVGVKDAGAAYNAQSGALLLPFTIIRAVVLVLVAAVPPIVNLAIIQPQISDNNRKITETLSFQAKSKEDESVADKLAASIANVDRRSQTLMSNLMPEPDLQDLVNKYVAALQRYGVELNSYNVSSEKNRKVVVGDLVQDAVIVELDLVTRYDVYTEIRNVFAKEAEKLTVVDETFQTQPGSVDLLVQSRVMVPVRRAYDEELDKAEAEGG